MIHKSSRLRDVITRYRVNGVTLRVLVFLSAAAAALSLLTLFVVTVTLIRLFAING